MTEWKVVGSETLTEGDYIPRGGARDLLYAHEHEVIIAGPAETGKTLAACWKSHLICLKYAGAQGALVRKVMADIPGTVLLTMKRVIGDYPVRFYGGVETPIKLVYPNGSQIWIGGLDRPGKILSAERDFIQVCQAEELKVEDWETMTTRVTGRGAVVPYPQIFGDCNPGGAHHWILDRAKTNLTVIQSHHRDNPTLYDDEGNLTEQGKVSMGVMESLTGVRKQRLLYGIWATAEGVVYDTYNPEVHAVHREPGEFKRWVLCMDEGYTNPVVILLVGIDGDGRQHIYKEFYKTGVLQKDVVRNAKTLGDAFNCDLCVVDGAAAGLIADLVDVRVRNVQGAKGRVLDGIFLVQSLLKVQGDGRPRLTVEPNCINTINEFESYVWKPEKDEPVKENDHAMDAIRYLQVGLGTSGPSIREWIEAYNRKAQEQENELL